MKARELKKLTKKIESLGWNITDEGKTLFLSKYSPLGEDFGFSVDKDSNIIQEIKNYAYNFDYEDHANIYIDMRGTRGVPNSIQALLDDAKDIKNMLLELANNL